MMLLRTGRPRLGVLDSHPIQYHAPLYQLITRRSRVELDVVFLTDDGHTSVVDPGFGVPVTWDIDLLAGYKHQFLTTFWQAHLASTPPSTPCAMGFRS